MMFALGIIIGLLLAIFDVLSRPVREQLARKIGQAFSPKGEIIARKTVLEQVMEDHV